MRHALKAKDHRVFNSCLINHGSLGTTHDRSPRQPRRRRDTHGATCQAPRATRARTLRPFVSTFPHTISLTGRDGLRRRVLGLHCGRGILSNWHVLLVAALRLASPPKLIK